LDLRGVSVNAHTLSDFRVAHEAFLDELLTKGVARLMEAGLVTLRRVSRDGMRVRASAGAASFRRRKRLRELEKEARRQVEALRRMGRAAAQEICELRAATSECVNAIARNRGLRQLPVRGRRKVRTVLLWFALAHDMMREIALRQAASEAA
jgi:hypothetical protein